jgi:hypothetical protein
MSLHKESNNIQNGSPNAILSRMFKKLCYDRGITPDSFNALLERYIVRSNLPRNLKSISSVRGNLRKELLKDTLSWKVFIKGLCFLNISRFDLVLRVHWGGSDKNIQEFSLPVAIDVNQSFNDEEDDD